MNTYSRIAAAAVIGVLAVGGTLYLIGPAQRAVGPPGPAVGASSTPDLASGASPSPSAIRPLPTPSSSPDPCLTFEIVTGDALADVTGDPSTGIGPGRGVFLAGSTLFAAGPGPARAIAVITPSNGGSVEVLDLSADGSTALIRAGYIGGGNPDPRCGDLLTVRTDGSVVTRLTSLEPGRIVTGAAFSPDGTRVAYSTSDGLGLSDPEGTLTVRDIASGRTVDQPCAATFIGDPHPVDWSPKGDMIALNCRLFTIFDASAAAAPLEAPTIADVWAFQWTDGGRLVVVGDGGLFRSFEVESQTWTIQGRLDESQIQFVLLSGSFSPDGRWLAYVGNHQDGSYAGYLVPTSGGSPTRVLGEDEAFAAWSADSRAIVHTTDGTLARVDVETLERSTIATISNYSMGVRYRHGVWRIP